MHGISLALVAMALLAGTATCYTCSSSEAQEGYALFKAAAARSGCAPYANYDAAGGVTINWSCATTSCTPTMMQLALQLPNCETATDGVNRKTTLESKLYNQCQFCTPDQQTQIAALWKAAAQTSACSKYATPGGTFFSWPCSATSCTATLKDLASKVPSCVIGTQNERTRITNGISVCTGTTVSTRTPSPASTSTGVTTTKPTTTKPPVEATTPAPTTRPTTTTTKPPSLSSSDASKAESESETTPAPAANYSSSACTTTETDEMLSLFVSTATSTNCKSYSTVSPYGVKISAPCSSSCVVININSLADALPDCNYAYEGENKKKAVVSALDMCSPTSGRRLGAIAEQYLTLQVDSKDAIKGVATSTTPAPTLITSAPAKSSAPPAVTSSLTWLVSAGAMLALNVAL